MPTYKTIKSVEIPYEDSIAVERLFYEWNSGRSNIAFLMKDSEITPEMLTKYIQIVDEKFMELEKLKKHLTTQYQPTDIEGDNEYEFDFDNHAILYKYLF